MKIAVVVDVYDSLSNGTTVSARRFVDNLRARGHQVTVITCGDPKEDVEGEIRHLKELTIGPLQFLVRNQNFKFCKPDKRILTEEFNKVDLVHVFLPLPLGFAAAKLAHEMKKPTLLAFHLHPDSVFHNIGLGWVPNLDRVLFAVFKKLYYCYADDIHCPTEFCRRELIRNNIKNLDMHVISNGFDSSRFYLREVEKPDAWKDKFVIFSVGRYSNEKCQDVLIKAVARSPYKDKIKLVFPGSGPKERAYKRLVRKYNLDADFGFIPQDKLPYILNAGDLYVHCAQIEVESLSCMEAFASGLVPVIGNAKKSATSYFALDERSVFKNKDSKDLCQKINYWIEHPEEHQRMRRAYAEHAKKFAIENTVTRMEELYETILRKHSEKMAAVESIDTVEVEPIPADVEMREGWLK